MAKKDIKNNIGAMGLGILEELQKPMNLVEETKENVEVKEESKKIRKTFVLSSDAIDKINILKAINPNEEYGIILEKAINIYFNSQKEQINLLAEQLKKFE
ncbi:hypothetical protein [Clostridium beijerinckii]|uniref:hypothetical protein n=1 Tax=Clostridium beijerinckii TaxID=1520 RepID=UPI00047D28A9|nr:hypothetical protein [Clostridium beijerinckii]